MIAASAVVPCTSRADDLAFASLVDAVRATDGMPDARIVGGHMVGLLLAAFPVPGLDVRRTTDADTALSTAIAAGGDVARRLLDLGYRQVDGSRFEQKGRTIDPLVEIPGTRFTPVDFDAGQLDGSPGLDLAIASDPIEIDLTVVFTDGSDARFPVRVPTVEGAVIIKTYAADSRNAPKDIADLYQLLEIRDISGRDDIGGWRLDDEQPIGRRLDAARILRRVQQRDRRFIDSEVLPTRFVELVREHIADV